MRQGQNLLLINEKKKVPRDKKQREKNGKESVKEIGHQSLEKREDQSLKNAPIVFQVIQVLQNCPPDTIDVQYFFRCYLLYLYQHLLLLFELVFVGDLDSQKRK